MTKYLCNYLCDTMSGKHYNNYKLAFVLVNCKIPTLTYYRNYLQLFMLNNDIRKIIYDN